MLDIHALRVFLEAAKTENFTEAGRKLNLSQPAVSMQIRSLENYLEVKLFKRYGRSIRLTSVGQALVPMAQQLVQMTISVEESVRSASGRMAGRLTIGCSTASGKYVLPHVVARFQRQYPDIHVSIPVVSHQRVVEGITSGDYNLGVVSKRSPDRDIGYEPFFTDQFVLIAPSTHPWARQNSVVPRELYSEKFICREELSTCRLSVARGLTQIGIDPAQLDIVMDVGNPEALAMAVEHGMGVSFVSLLAAIPRLTLGRLAIINVEGLHLTTEVELMYSCARPASPIQTEFLEFIQQPKIQSLIDMLAEGHMV